MDGLLEFGFSTKPTERQDWPGLADPGPCQGEAACRLQGQPGPAGEIALPTIECIATRRALIMHLSPVGQGQARLTGPKSRGILHWSGPADIALPPCHFA